MSVLCELQEQTKLLQELIAKQCELNKLLSTPCEESGQIIQDRICRSYGNPLTGGYANWSDIQELENLSSEFGIILGSEEIYVRILEFDCGGVSQPQTGMQFGPYSVPSANAADVFYDDLASATSESCLTVSPGPGVGPGGSGSNLNYSYDSTQDATLIIQEGVIDANTNTIAWFGSAQGFVVRDGVAGDFVSSSGNSATTNYAANGVNDFPSYQDAEDCEAI